LPLKYFVFWQPGSSLNWAVVTKCFVFGGIFTKGLHCSQYLEKTGNLFAISATLVWEILQDAAQNPHLTAANSSTAAKESINSWLFFEVELNLSLLLLTK